MRGWPVELVARLGRHQLVPLHYVFRDGGVAGIGGVRDDEPALAAGRLLRLANVVVVVALGAHDARAEALGRVLVDDAAGQSDLRAGKGDVEVAHQRTMLGQSALRSDCPCPGADHRSPRSRRASSLSSDHGTATVSPAARRAVHPLPTEHAPRRRPWPGASPGRAGGSCAATWRRCETRRRCFVVSRRIAPLRSYRAVLYAAVLNSGPGDGTCGIWARSSTT